MRSLAPLAAILLIGCGAQTDPGSGTQTLTALVEILATAERTVIEVDLRAGANPIANADVTLEDVNRGNSATATGENGSFRASFNGYARTVRIEINTPDGDELQAQLQGPAPHTITRPADGFTVLRGDFDSLKVTWDASEDAQGVELEAADGGPVFFDNDSGEAELPLGPLLNGSQDLAVRRQTSVKLAGGIPGSKMRSRYETQVRFTLQ